ncbi:hypothetical protein D3C79_826520 [compost metagenome]
MDILENVADSFVAFFSNSLVLPFGILHAIKDRHMMQELDNFFVAKLPAQIQPLQGVPELDVWQRAQSGFAITQQIAIVPTLL